MWTSMDVEVDVEVDAEVEVDGDVHVDAEVDVVVDGPGRCPGNFVPPHGGSVCFWGQSSYHDLLLGVHPVRCKKIHSIRFRELVVRRRRGASIYLGIV